jgi:hypothetical protein
MKADINEILHQMQARPQAGQGYIEALLRLYEGSMKLSMKAL